MKRIAFYGGSFDPVHKGHVAIAHGLMRQFGLDQFVFLPAYHAPHKSSRPTSAFDRYAMLCLVTQDEPAMLVSRMEIEIPEQPFSYQTLARIDLAFPRDEKFFVMGADSWSDITTWRNWRDVLSSSNHIVVTRPDFTMDVSHVGEPFALRVEDLRGSALPAPIPASKRAARERTIYFSDAVDLPYSATLIRRKIRSADPSWISDVPNEVAKYIEKYQIYK